MEEEHATSSGLFLGLVQDYQIAALVHLGKLVHPESGKSERNLDAARGVIDLLGMIEEKTKGNLTADEDRFLKQVVTNLRLNFIDESNRKEEAPKDDEKKEESGSSGGTTQDESP